MALEITPDDAAGDEAARRHARGYAFTIGAMGSGSTNFYNEAFGRLGFADEVAEVERLWRAGQREEAADAVPLELGARTNLVGTEATIAARLPLYRAGGHHHPAGQARRARTPTSSPASRSSSVSPLRRRTAGAGHDN